jgi:hypothetical protein
MRTLPWIIGGGAAALAAYYWRHDRNASPTSPDDAADSPKLTDRTGNSPAKGTSPENNTTSTQLEPLPGRWVWPVGIWRERKPEISDGFSSKRRLPSGQVVTHGGVDVMYRRRPGDPWAPGTPNGTPQWVMPDHRPALAASEGVVLSAAKTPRGWEVVIDHAPRKLATYYAPVVAACRGEAAGRRRNTARHHRRRPARWREAHALALRTLARRRQRSL